MTFPASVESLEKKHHFCNLWKNISHETCKTREATRGNIINWAHGNGMKIPITLQLGSIKRHLTRNYP